MFDSGARVVSLVRPTIPACCKFWLPLTETGGTTVTDIASGCLFPTQQLDSATVANAIGLRIDGGATSGQAPTVGVLPDPSTKDYILFAVMQMSDSGVRANNNVYIGDGLVGAESFGISDGDAQNTSTNGVVAVACDCNAGANSGVEGLAQVRRGRNFGTWIHTDTPSAAGNTYIQDGDIVCQTPIEDHVRVGGSFTTTEFTSDYAPDLDPTTNYTSHPDLSGNIDAAFPALWAKAADGYAVPYANRLTVGLNTGALDPHYYFGIAMFVFDAGLPSDFKEALRWMRDQWIAGNKVIWPAWADL